MPFPTPASDHTWDFVPDEDWNRCLMASPLGPTHGGLVMDRQGYLYCSTDGPRSVIVFSPDGSLFVADGYGASLIHQFDAQRRYVKSFGGAEAGVGQVRNCHGLALDNRGPAPLLLVCDRRNRRLVHYDLEGRFVGVLGDNPDQTLWANYEAAPAQWRADIFTAPHSVCFDQQGHLFVQEWSRTGRLTKFVRQNSICSVKPIPNERNNASRETQT